MLETFELLAINYIVVENYQIITQKSFENNNYKTLEKVNSFKPAKTVSSKNFNGKSIKIGDTVTCLYEASGDVEKYQIIKLNKKVKYYGCGGSYYGAASELVIDESIEFRENQISEESPVGKALLGTELGESIVIKLPNNKDLNVKIINIEKPIEKHN